MSIFSRVAFASICILAGFSTIALAQQGRPEPNGGCILDNCLDRAPAADRVRRPGPTADPDDAPAPDNDNRAFRRGPSAAAGRFDYYLLSLSWSSGFCATGGAEKARNQCDIGSNLGFVVHGLWPQLDRGMVNDCDPSARPPTRAALDQARGLFPEEGLARYEWRKHGTCSGKSATDYFADVRYAREAVKIPPEFEKLKQDEKVAPGDIMRAFQEANPRLRPGMMAINCQRGVLQEVRICFSKDLREFRSCPDVSRNSCRSSQITVPRPR